ncbi:hypothetical protein CPB86DRAFT_817971 [Serendipita vermifera]|nr:hypothetical protein CPB86DRAFT_817971 [Serendipita vermifera]
MFPALISSVTIFLLGASHTLAAPQASETLSPSPEVCTTPSYGPFKLFADDGATSYPVRLKRVTSLSSSSAFPVNSTMVVDKNSACSDCGVIPSYWVLKNKQLFAVDPTLSSDIQTVNKDVTKGSQLSFITSVKDQPAYPIYCALTSSAGLATQLEVHGTPDKFSMCAWTSISPRPTNFDVVYSAGPILPVGESCYKIKLIAQSIGIVPT